MFKWPLVTRNCCFGKIMLIQNWLASVVVVDPIHFEAMRSQFTGHWLLPLLLLLLLPLLPTPSMISAVNERKSFQINDKSVNKRTTFIWWTTRQCCNRFSTRSGRDACVLPFDTKTWILSESMRRTHLSVVHRERRNSASNKTKNETEKWKNK